MPAKKNKNFFCIILIISVSVLFGLGLWCFFTNNWIMYNFGPVGLDSILFTISNPLEGDASIFLTKSYLEQLLYVVIISLTFAFILYMLSKYKTSLSQIILTVLIIIAPLNCLSGIYIFDA